MASQSQHRHLKDLLKEEQEPFLLLQNQPLLSPRNHQLNKKPNQNASFPSRLCQNACFSSSFHNADSPLFSPAAAASKSPFRALFLHVPAKTAALLLEAAIRIQKNSPAPNPNPKPKNRIRNSGFALLGSVIRRLTNRSQTQKLRTRKTGDSNGGGDGDFIRWADSVKTSAARRVENRVGLETVLAEKSDLGEHQMGVSNGRLSSVWSEENKSPSSSSSSESGSGNLSEEEGDDEVGFVNALEKENGGNGDEDFKFSLSPLSPFRFALYKSSSPGRRSPAFSSPAMSPPRRKFQDHVKYEQDPSADSQLQDDNEEEEQSSPVSILDSPFGEDDCEEEEEWKRRDEEHGFNTECSYAFMQRSKQHLLQKLRKFEALALAGLDQDEDDYKELEYCKRNNDIEGYLVDITRNSGVAQDLLRPGMKRLLYDLISEEERSAECSSSGDGYESVVKRVCKRLECWKEVEPNTIDMMIGMDLRGEGDEWRKSREDISWTATMLEVSIFAILVDELLDDLVS